LRLLKAIIWGLKLLLVYAPSAIEASFCFYTINTCTDRQYQILEVCYKSGVKVVTIYAFSIENFKRSKYEVDALMEMAKTKLGQLAQHGALLDRYGAAIRILGQRDLVKPDVLEAIDKAVLLTQGNKR
jgi:undecaprenyl diphosphate synthase